MNFAYTILYVEDVKASLDFYQQAFGMRPRFLHDSGGYGELETGATALAFASHAMLRDMHKNPHKAKPDAPCFEIAFTTDDVPGALQQALAAGATLVQQAQPMPWGQTIAYVSDMNGFLVELCTPMS
jgi:catechol 2,3-dioxygenase-like lactoylglutathione lyase family enzyme